MQYTLTNVLIPGMSVDPTPASRANRRLILNITCRAAQAEAQPGGRYSVVTEFMLRLLVRSTIACLMRPHQRSLSNVSVVANKLVVCRALTMCQRAWSAT
jgi:hypothetical protein